MLSSSPLTAGVTLLIVLLMFGTSFAVGKGRHRYGVEAPAVTGHPVFERLYRVQMNTLEWAVMTLPCLWIAAAYVIAALTTLAAIIAMTFNFVLNNELTYSDKRLRGFGPLLRGWAQFGLTCSLGLLTNIGSAAVLKTIGFHSVVAVIVGIVLGSVWNFALSSRFVWGKY